MIVITDAHEIEIEGRVADIKTTVCRIGSVADIIEIAIGIIGVRM